jgi:hypothetical protein
MIRKAVGCGIMVDAGIDSFCHVSGIGEFPGIIVFVIIER